jgi:hypothetical protein
MGGRHRGHKNAYITLVWKPQGKRPKWEDNRKVEVREIA